MTWVQAAFQNPHSRIRKKKKNNAIVDVGEFVRRLAGKEQENARQTGRCESPPVDLQARGALGHRLTCSIQSTGLILGLAELRTRKEPSATIQPPAREAQGPG